MVKDILLDMINWENLDAFFCGGDDRQENLNKITYFQKKKKKKKKKK